MLLLLLVILFAITILLIIIIRVVVGVEWEEAEEAAVVVMMVVAVAVEFMIDVEVHKLYITEAHREDQEGLEGAGPHQCQEVNNKFIIIVDKV